MLQIRAMRSEDVEALIDLWVESWRETVPTIDFDARRSWIAAILSDPAYATLVAERDALLGFVSLKGRTMHQLVVAPKAKGTGVARTLLHAVRSRATAALDLEVNRDNHRAVAFYRREGFKESGTSTNPNSGLPTLRMTWQPEEPGSEMPEP